MVPLVMQMQQWLSIAINYRQTPALPTWASGLPGPPACGVQCLPLHLTSALPPVLSPPATLSFHCLQAFLLLEQFFFFSFLYYPNFLLSLPAHWIMRSQSWESQGASSCCSSQLKLAIPWRNEAIHHSSLCTVSPVPSGWQAHNRRSASVV